MPRSNSTSYLGNKKLKGEGVNIPLTMKQLEEYQKCYNDPIYFIKNYVKIVNVDHGEIFFDLWPFQEQMVKNFAKNRFTIVKCPRQVGKALALDTPIPTPSGWKTMGDISAGDEVFGSDGKPTQVIEEHDVLYGRECFSITFDNDESIVADAEHLWTVENPDWRSPKTFTTKELIPVIANKQRTGSGVRIRLAANVEFNKQKNLPVDPYVLGVWLGDGNSYNGQYTGALKILKV